MTRERNESYIQPSRQPNGGGKTDAQTPTLPAIFITMRCLLHGIWGVETWVPRCVRQVLMGRVRAGVVDWAPAFGGGGVDKRGARLVVFSGCICSASGVSG